METPAYREVLCYAPGSILCCVGGQNYTCVESVHISEYIPQHRKDSFKCAKCCSNSTWILPGEVVKAGCYTSCTMCKNQFVCKRDYLGSKPKCPECR